MFISSYLCSNLQAIVYVQCQLYKKWSHEIQSYIYCCLDPKCTEANGKTSSFMLTPL